MKAIWGIILLCITACTEYPEYPDIPRVEFSSANLSMSETDKNVDFIFNLYDGNGDVGLSPSDTSSPFIDSLRNNFNAKMYVKQNGTFHAMPYNLSYRIPLLRDKKSTKFLKAEVTINMSFAKAVFPYDTLYFTYFVYDRALNKSNVDTSKVIVFPIE